MSEEHIEEALAREYAAGFVTAIEQELAPAGLSEDIVRFISKKKNEPEWLLDWRLRAYRIWQRMKPPTWAKVSFPDIDYQDISYYAAPKSMENAPKSLDEVDPKLLETYEKIRARPNPELQFLGVVITLHDRRTVLSRDIQRQIREVFGDKVFKTTISKSVRLEESPAYKQSIFSFAPNSSGALEYYSLSEEVIDRV